jgi:soluble lytic murein transglycosylase-like protein
VFQEETMTLLSCIYFYSFLNGINPQITQAVISVESNGNPFALSKDRLDGGLMQIRMKYVSESKLQLLQSCTNVRRGTELLKQAMLNCKHKAENTWLVCYNAGLAGGSRLKHPKKFSYYKKVTARL